MSTIGNINIILSATTDVFTAGLNKAQSALSSFVSAVESVGHAFTTPMALLGEAATVGGMAMMLRSSMDNAAALARLSSEMGVPVDRMNGLQHAARMCGVATDELAGYMQKMEKSVAVAAGGTGPAAAALDRMRLSAAKLANETPDKQLIHIAEALKNVHNASERAEDAWAIFGKTGAQMTYLLQQGEAGMNAFIARAKQLNPALDGISAQKILAANRALEQMKEKTEGTVTAIAAELAPYIEIAAQKLTDMGLQGKGAAGWIIKGMEMVGKAVAYVADALKSNSGMWAKWAATVADGIIASIKGVQKLVGALEIVGAMMSQHAVNFGYNSIGKLATDFQKVKTEMVAIGASMDSAQSKFSGAAVAKWIADLKEKANAAAAANDKLAMSMSSAAFNGEAEGKRLEKVTKILDEMSKAANDVGLSSAQRKLNELSDAGADFSEMITGQMIAAYQDLAEGGKKAYESLTADAKRMFEETRTPLEKYEDGLKKLHQEMEAHLIDQDTFDRASLKLQKDMDKATTPKHDRKVGAEVASVSYTVTSNMSDWTDKLVDQGKQQIDLAKKQNDTLDGIASSFDNAQLLEVMSF